MVDTALYLGDCLEIMPTLPQVDAIITDLPYGTTACSWDEIIPFEPMWREVKRICKGAFVTTASQPFTTDVINSNRDWYKYSWVWDKVICTNPFIAHNQPMRTTEDICVFYMAQPTYNPILIDKPKPNIRNNNVSVGHNSPVYGHKNTYGRNEYRKIPTDKMYPKNIIRLSNKSRYLDKQHPTQKPVALYEYLIRTYTNEGDTVLDICAGSGTTGVACVNTGRNFIGIELREDYFKIMESRIAEAKQQMRMEFA